MTENSQGIEGLEARMTAALARIEAGLSKWPAAGVTGSAQSAVEAIGAADTSQEVADLQAKLEEERTANAQLEQRVQQIRQRQEQRMEGYADEITSLKEQLAAAESQAANLRRSSADMRQALEAMQAASSDGAPDAHMINRAMMAELTALRTERAADAEEIGALVSALEPLLEEGAGSA
ncbi:MAG: hypothetical protein AAGB18_04595 [Pseudomonadota bacterium]